MKKIPGGIIVPLTGPPGERTPDRAVVVIVSKLNEYYSVNTNTLGELVRFERGERITHGSRKKKETWKNYVKYVEDNTLYARVNIQHLESEDDFSYNMSGTQHEFAVYFNVCGRNKSEKDRLSWQEAEDYLLYLEAKTAQRLGLY